MNFRADKKRLLNYILYSVIIILGIVIDQISKRLAVVFLKGQESFPLIDGVLQFTYVENRGAAFGMLKDSRWVFMTVSVVAIVIMLAYLFTTKNENRLYTVSIAVIISGGIGNMIDRIWLGYVVDFIDFCLIDFAVFNLADSLVCVGAGLLILALILDIVKESKKLKKEDGEK